MDDPPPEHDRHVRTAYLGRYADFEADVVLELLHDAGIFAFAKHESTEPDHIVYTKIFESERGVIMVDARRLDEARALVETELPLHLASIEVAMEELDADGDADVTPGEEDDH